MRWKARSSSPAPPCNGCATGWHHQRCRGQPARWPPPPIPTQAVYLVPAFVGLGAPYWDAEARGTLIRPDPRHRPSRARPRRARGGVLPDPRSPRGDARRLAGRQAAGDGAARRWRHGRLELDHAVPRRHHRAPVDRPQILETTALGAAYLAGLSAGLYPEPERFADTWRLETRFLPKLNNSARASKVAGWRDAVSRTLTRA